MPQAVTELRLVTIRLRAIDVDHAKVIAERLSIPYQHVVRGWVANQSDRVRRVLDPSRRRKKKEAKRG